MPSIDSIDFARPPTASMKLGMREIGERFVIVRFERDAHPVGLLLEIGQRLIAREGRRPSA